MPIFAGHLRTVVAQEWFQVWCFGWKNDFGIFDEWLVMRCNRGHSMTIDSLLRIETEAKVEKLKRMKLEVAQPKIKNKFELPGRK